MQPYPPLQTLIAAARMRECGYSVALADITLADSADAVFRAALEAHHPRLVAVIEDSFNFLTKMCTTVNRELAFCMSAAAREAGVPAIANGSDASDRPAAYLDAGFAAVITGEVERTLEDGARHHLRGDCELNRIASVSVRHNGAVHRTGIRAPVAERDA